MINYIRRDFARTGIDIRTGVTIESLNGKEVRLSDGTMIKQALLVWTSGMKTPELKISADLFRDKQGRFRVDENLKMAGSCYAAGDIAHFTLRGQALRLSVQFAVTQGESAAANILSDSQDKPPGSYRPFDPGFIVPLADNRSCGVVLGIRIRGLTATIGHFIMSIYRSYGSRNKKGLIRKFIREV